MSLSITKHSDSFSSAPQITSEDITEIAALGYKTIINARPDHEGGSEQPTSDKLEKAAGQAGLEYVHIPVVPKNIQASDVQICASFITHAPTPILGFCRTGMRATSLHTAAQQHNNPDTSIAEKNGLMAAMRGFFQNKCLLTKLYRKLATK